MPTAVNRQNLQSADPRSRPNHARAQSEIQFLSGQEAISVDPNGQQIVVDMDDLDVPVDNNVASGVLGGIQSDNEVLQVNNLLKSNGGLSDSNLLAQGTRTQDNLRTISSAVPNGRDDNLLGVQKQ